MLVDYRVRQREYLLAISRALTAELDLSDVLRIIVQASVEFISGRAGVIVLGDPSDRSFRIAAIYGIPRDLFDDFAPLLQGFSYRDESEQEVIPELTRQMKQVAKAANLTQIVSLPMMSGDTVIGVIYVFQAENYWFGQDATNLLQSFADQAAIAVKNARLYQEIIAEKQRLDAIIEQSADGVMTLDRRLVVTVFNSALSRMTGWNAHDAIGRPHHEVVRWARLKTDVDLEQALENGWPLPGAAHLYVEGDLKRPDGELINVGVTYAPLLNHRGLMTNVIANVRDLTRFREEERLHKTFISVVSHELKTPVSIIKGYAGTLQRRDADWPLIVQREYLAVIEEEADRLTELIDNLLEASRLQSGAFKLELSDAIALHRLAEETARKFSSQSERHTFKLEFPANFPTVRGDERRLVQVLNNLINNAIKYAPDGGEITIRGEVYGDDVMVSVRDEGIGIPEHEHHRIFQQFSRLDNALSRSTEGAGLGLFLTKAIVEAHDGRIWFQSNENEPGTTFTFCLPKNQDESKAEG
jgi:PAS domain S-box-containing protein